MSHWSEPSRSSPPLSGEPGPSAIQADEQATFPRTLGDLVLLRELGRGGMGIVYEAEQRSMGRRVAVKILPQNAFLDNKLLQRFQNEIRAVAALDHPHIVAIYGMGMEQGCHFFTMQLVRGPSLADILAEMRRTHAGGNIADTGGTTAQTAHAAELGPFAHDEYYRRVAAMGRQGCQALQHAHDVGILHRDIKPSNLLIDADRRLFVTDFGLARIETEPALTATGMIVGTLRYMAPEQALVQGGVVDHRVDIYALGASLYELLSLQPAFAESDHARLLMQIALEDPTRLRKLDRRIPLELETIVHKAMAKEPRERYPSASAMAADLQAFLDGRPIVARPATLVDRVRSWSRRHTGIVRVALASLILLTVLLAISTFFVRRAQLRTAEALDRASNLLYVADIASAYQAYEIGWPEEARRILDQYKPQQAELDRRGLEWHLLDASLERPDCTFLTGHKGAVTEIALFPDHRRLASVGNDGTLRLWDLVERKLLRTIELTGDELQSVAVSPSGRYVAAGSDHLFLCDLASDAPAKEIFKAGYTIESLAFHPTLERIAAGVRYDNVCLLDFNGEIIKQVTCGARVESLEFSADGALLAFPNKIDTGRGDTRGVAEIWKSDLSGLEYTIRDTANDPANIMIARFVPDSTSLLGADMYAAKAIIFGFSNNLAVAKPPSRGLIRDVAVGPDGKTVAIAYHSGQVEFLDLQQTGDGKPAFPAWPKAFTAHRGVTSCVRYLDQRTLVTAGEDGVIAIWNLPPSAAVATRASAGSITGVKVSPDGQLMMATNLNGWTLSETQSARVTTNFHDQGQRFASPSWTTKGDRVAIACTTRDITTVLDREGKQTWTIDSAGASSAVAFSPDSSMLAAIGSQYFQLYSSDRPEPVFTEKLPSGGVAIAFSPDGSTVAFGGQFPSIHLLDVRNRKPLPPLAGSTETKCIAISPDGRTLVSGHNDAVLRFWNLPKRTLLAELVGHERPISEIIFSADGRTLLSSGDDGTIRLWSVNLHKPFGEIFRFLPKGDSCCAHLGASRDMSVIAAAFESGTYPGQNLFLWKCSR